ncbi:hypothetical protein HYDPIDRAFT_114207 [Hydnomerulius pinastri MD-312]|uniref:Uncharacterized protein n=1 Tax=Hydnomerulius pinastri MD-312 TaxID=994086 RepID=A0A0C9W6L2_9AGAM|nr:hypothetical protein HYDPIDRAFT_114207 [Hydnomerulius pinastri MD-312]
MEREPSSDADNFSAPLYGTDRSGLAREMARVERDNPPVPSSDPANPPRPGPSRQATTRPPPSVPPVSNTQQPRVEYAAPHHSTNVPLRAETALSHPRTPEIKTDDVLTPKILLGLKPELSFNPIIAGDTSEGSSARAGPSSGELVSHSQPSLQPASHPTGQPTPARALPTQDLIPVLRKRKILEVDDHAFWHETASPNPILRPPLAQTSGGDPIKLYVHRIEKIPCGPLIRAQLWVMRQGGDWNEIDITRAEPIRHWEYERYVLWVNSRGQPGWIKRESWNANMAKVRKAQGGWYFVGGVGLSGGEGGR